MTDIEQHITLTDRSVPMTNIAVEDTQALSSQSLPCAEYEELAVVIAISAGEFSRRKLKKYIFSRIEDSTETQFS
ncbi:hypothetical protein N7495_000472 [Penicillium taxi]|uniref:uncharacterized protein n=1 Tax=Penicillium taxi TaxID=168475 RepID=UPI00254551DF|nr:uncharacterized protein N7495_000472 [Penicillium taxi]KAJ5907790.1 hypothetical protein N7495_000472 [Penicillium taxi]